MSGALILVLVYFMAIGLASDRHAGGLGVSNVSLVASVQVSTPVPTAVLAVTPTVSATAIDLPTNPFITEAETASGVDSAASKAIHPTTMFRVNERVYMVLHLHPASQGGAVCLLWYLNGKETGQFEFAISAGETIAYSYTIYEQVGAGYVDVYWASTTSCGDKLLAQHVVFTVTA